MISRTNNINVSTIIDELVTTIQLNCTVRLLRVSCDLVVVRYFSDIRRNTNRAGVPQTGSRKIDVNQKIREFELQHAIVTCEWTANVLKSVK